MSPATDGEATLDEIRDLEARVARAMRSADVADAFALMAADPSIHPQLRRAVARARPAGVTMSALLVAKVRFERLVQGSDDARAWFERDPGGFAEAFRAYHESVAPTSFFPGAEARLFHAWMAGTGPAP